MTSSAPRRLLGRRIVVHLGIAMMLGGVAARLVYLQYLSREAFADQASRQQVTEETIPARPGDIVDRVGRLLATTIRVPSLYADPSRVDNPDEVAERLAPLLDLSAEELANQLRQSSKRRFLWIRRRLTDEEFDAVLSLELSQEAFGFRFEFERHYPQGQTAAHVLGLRDIDGVGHGGIEQSYDDLLRGTDGARTIVRDARGYTLDVLEEVSTPPRDGATLVLTLDSVVQTLVERRLDELINEYRPQSACAIVLEPQTGAILAMASRPTFDPNQPAGVAESVWKNHAIASVYEPGSTFKPLVVAWALEHEKIVRDEMWDCEWGAYRMGHRVLHDHHPYGTLTLSDVLAKSSNIGMAKIGQRIGLEGLYEVVQDFGFGHPTGIDLPGELKGLVRPRRAWNEYSIGSIPMGQEIAATPLQMIASHAVLANGGRRVSPHLLDRVAEEERPARSVLVTQVLSPEIAEWIVQNPLQDVIRRGTGRQAQLADYHVFGKTGTAQKVDAETGGYSSTRHISSFVCGAPAEQPRVLVIVSVDEPAVTGNQYGGTVAAPAAADMLRKTLVYLRVPPSHDEQQLSAR